jgi:hypothetical protein
MLFCIRQLVLQEQELRAPPMRYGFLDFELNSLHVLGGFVEVGLGKGHLLVGFQPIPHRRPGNRLLHSGAPGFRQRQG